MWREIISIDRNPISLVKVQGATERVRKLRSLTVEEFQKLSDQSKEPFRTIALVSVCLGLRISECLALRWGDIDWLNRTVSIERGIIRQIVDGVKTDGSRKTFVVADELLDVLRRWKQRTQFPVVQDWMFASPLKLGRLPYALPAAAIPKVRAS